MRYDRLKRAIDVSLAVSALVGSLPVQAAVAIAVRARLGTPVLFGAGAPGAGRQALGHLSNSGRCTPFGSKPRVDQQRGRVWAPSGSGYVPSLDELPSLPWNIVRGDLSIVGPRPLLMEYLPLYTYEQLAEA